MITIPAMHPCPELYIDADVPVVRGGKCVSANR